MILRGDVALFGVEVGARLVVATIAKLHLKRLCAGRNRKNLMSQADAKDGLVGAGSHERLQVLNRLTGHLWVPGTVAEEQAVELGLGEVIVPRHQRDVRSTCDEASQLIVLETHIYGQNLDVTRRIKFADLLCGDVGDQVHNVRIEKINVGLSLQTKKVQQSCCRNAH